jgi:hypothetical protein
LISIALQIPLYRLVGIDWKDIGFVLPYTILQLGIVILFGSSLHLGLRFRKVASELIETIAIVTVMTAAFAPFFVIINYPSAVKIFSLIQEAKRSNAPLNDIIAGVWRGLQSGNSVMDNIQGAANAFNATVSVLVGAMIAKAITKHYRADKYNVILWGLAWHI